MTRGWTPKYWYSIAQCLLGGVGLALATFVCFRLRVNIAIVGYVYLVLIVFLAQMGSFIGSIVLSILAVGCLAYFFSPPILSFQMDEPEDLLAVIAFLMTSLLVNRLIAQRSRTENALRQSDMYLTEAQRISHTGSFGWKVASGEIIWSEESFRIFEYDQAIKASLELVLKRIHPDDLAVVRERLESASRDGKAWELSHRLLMPDGSIKHVKAAANSVKDASGNLEFIGAVMDVTAARRAEEDLHQARAELARVTRVTMLGELTAAIAHEVNQPLAGLVSSGNACMRWLADAPPDLDAARRSVERMINDGNRASEIISRIRALVKKSPSRREWVNINDTIIGVIELIRTEVQRNRIMLRTEPSIELPLIMGDQVQLQQVVLNLTMNAIEALGDTTQEQRLLSIIAAESGSNGVLVEVRDSGTGLDVMALDRLFDAFWSTKPDGMGMGLAISRAIIEAHGGRLWATPNEPRGAVFHFSLPHDGELVP